MKKLLFIILALIFSIKSDGLCQNVSEITQLNQIFSSSVNKLAINSSLHFNQVQMSTWLNKNFFPSREINVTLVKQSKYFKIFNVEIGGDLPNNDLKVYTVVNATKENFYFLLPFEFNQIINVDNQKMVGGIYSYREFEYYFIYKQDSQLLKLIFDSRKINGTGLKIGYYRDDDCIEYLPNRLTYVYDNKNTIHFYGFIKEFCKAGYDRNPSLKNPLHKRKVAVRIDYRKGTWVYNVKSDYQFW